MVRSTKVAAIAAAAGLALILSACSKASDAATTTSAAAPATSAAASDTAAASTAASDTAASSVAASGGTVAGCTPSTKANPYIAIVSKGFQHQFWQAVKLGAEQEAKKEGATITFEGPASESDIQPQLDQLKSALAKNPDAIGFAALDSKAAAPILADAQSKHIPVIAFDSGVDSTIPVTTASTDNKAAAGEAAKHMAELVGNKGTVALVVHDQTSKTGIDRRDGFIAWMKANAPGIKVLAPQYGGGDAAKSADITKSIIAGNPDLVGIYGANEGSAIGVIQGVKESGKSAIKVVGFDSGQAQLDAIAAGTEAGAITQNPVGIGEQTVAAAIKALKCMPQEKIIDTGYFWYDKTNIADPKIAAVLYK